MAIPNDVLEVIEYCSRVIAEIHGKKLTREGKEDMFCDLRAQNLAKYKAGKFDHARNLQAIVMTSSVNAARDMLRMSARRPSNYSFSDYDAETIEGRDDMSSVIDGIEHLTESLTPTEKQAIWFVAAGITIKDVEQLFKLNFDVVRAKVVEAQRERESTDE